MPTRKDWLALKERKEHTPDNLQGMLRAAVNAATLTGSPQWDEYLSYLQAAVEQTQAQRQGFVERLAGDGVIASDDVMRLKLAIARCDERIKAWTTAMELPNDLKRNGEQAKAVLDRMEGLTA